MFELVHVYSRVHECAKVFLCLCTVYKSKHAYNNVVFKCIQPTFAIRLRGSWQEGGSADVSFCARSGAS